MINAKSSNEFQSKKQMTALGRKPQFSDRHINASFLPQRYFLNVLDVIATAIAKSAAKGNIT